MGSRDMLSMRASRITAVAVLAALSQAQSDPAPEWLAWRGAAQNGTSTEVGLPDRIALDGEHHLWSFELAGRGAPVVADGRVYALGYEGEDADLQEILICLDERTGHELWRHSESDFNSDIVYDRYAIGSPTVDPETRNVYAMTGAGLLHGFTPQGEMLWQVSLSEEFGRLSFPNGRTGAPLILGDLVIIHYIFSGWGALAPASDRFFAFEKHSGDVAWVSTPSGRPIDSSFSFPFVEHRDGRALLYAGLGGGKVACVDARTGDPVWRFPLAAGGLNSSPVVHGDKLIVMNGKENLNSSNIGCMVALNLSAEPGADGVLPASAELWRNDLVAFTSSPVVVGDMIYVTTQTGELHGVDATDGSEVWEMDLGSDQLHASPAYADGKLYVPLNDGSLHIVRITGDEPELLDRVQLEGNGLGAPAIAGGRIFVHTTRMLYGFGDGEARATDPVASPPARGSLVAQAEPAGKPVRLQVIPADVTLHAGDARSFRIRKLDAQGRAAGEVAMDSAELEVHVPDALGPTWENGVLSAATAGAANLTATLGELTGDARVRVVPHLPTFEDFESFALDQGGDEPFAAPPGHWLSAGPKWRVVMLDGNKVIERVMNIPLFQRTQSFIGHARESGYTLQADMMSDGNRRTLSSPGLINQRYLFELKGNHQAVEITSNDWRVKESVPFAWKAGVWHTMKTRVDVHEDGSGVARAKVWVRDEAEPDAWTIEVPLARAHRYGAPGVFGFTPQSRFTIYLDNISVASSG